ncbi:MBL fold metallo-hydrolase [Halobaculum sp. MBLA0147]|uniref:MBL fold metallo-hydrolase n=1 Tax=Halobaculum sp. MBLA0147 TaxID=3079934 RepID=UPI0035253001
METTRTPTALAEQLRAGEPVSILDVRDRDEFERWHVTGGAVTARQVPHVRFVAAEATGDPTESVPEALSEPIVVVCGRGEASDQVAAMLRERGLAAVNLAEGMDGFARVLLAADLPPTDDVATGTRPEHVRAETPEPDRVTIRQYQRPASGCLSYLVAVGDEALVIDPLRAFTDRYADDAAALGATLRYAVDTHVHADHVSGVHALAGRTGARPVLPAGARERGFASPDGTDFRFLEDGDTLSLDGTDLTTIHAPGHTHEHVALHGLGHLFSGDALFLTSVGRPDLEAGGGEAARELAGAAYETLHERLLTLPATTVLAPGHVAELSEGTDGRYTAPLATVGELPILGLERAAFVDRVATELPPRPSNYEEIVATNLGETELDAAAAFEAELGPNNCAVAGD